MKRYWWCSCECFSSNDVYLNTFLYLYEFSLWSSSYLKPVKVQKASYCFIAPSIVHGNTCAVAGPTNRFVIKSIFFSLYLISYLSHGLNSIYVELERKFDNYIQLRFLFIAYNCFIAVIKHPWIFQQVVVFFNKKSAIENRKYIPLQRILYIKEWYQWSSTTAELKQFEVLF